MDDSLDAARQKKQADDELAERLRVQHQLEEIEAEGRYARWQSDAADLLLEFAERMRGIRPTITRGFDTGMNLRKFGVALTEIKSGFQRNVLWLVEVSEQYSGGKAHYSLGRNGKWDSQYYRFTKNGPLRYSGVTAGYGVIGHDDRTALVHFPYHPAPDQIKRMFDWPLPGSTVFTPIDELAGRLSRFVVQNERQ